MEINHHFWLALDELISKSEIVIDRPKGTAHPRFPSLIYEVDYGYIKNTASMDGGGIDVWRGTAADLGLDAIIVTVDMMKRDSEIKLLIDCSEAEKQTVCRIMNSGPMHGLLIRR